jgi:hypothetical protein
LSATLPRLLSIAPGERILVTPKLPRALTTTASLTGLP